MHPNLARRCRPLTPLLLAAALAVCAGRYRGSEAARATPLDTLVLEVDNHNWSDVVIYIVTDGQRTRLADVGAARFRSFTIPVDRQGTMGVFRLIVHAIGTRQNYVTEPISNRSGNTVHLSIENDLARSSVGIW